ncbi:MAG: family 20 glycosylhydrolase [Rikenellaceae bacterium]|nr:family 20 glycosylhydrolase [Rikenellaceae bacterium]MCL2692718.1 family 20 glycosylhydrolase [Rikenellaceae bacterium]
MKRLLFLLAVAAFAAACDKPVNPADINIIPLPVKMETGKGYFAVTSQTTVSYASHDLKEQAELLVRLVKADTGIEMTVAGEGDGGDIVLSLKPEVGDDDAYRLTVTKKGVRLEAANPRSAVLGIQTIRQLFPADGGKMRLPAVRIEDAPAWGWRGMHLDVSRHFFAKQEVMEFLDLMAFYKLNKFHWHLTDDQGWRIEIKKYPQLTEVSGWRQFNNHDLGCIAIARRDHNPDYMLPQDRLRERNGVTEYGGYYTQEDVREVVAYAAALGIDVIPEIDMPGHMSGAIAAFPQLSCFDQAGWGETFSAPICPGKDWTLQFCKDVYAEIFELFPYEYAHLGADEVEKINWEKCPHCRRRIKTEGLANEKELQSWFVRQMEQFFIDNGRKMIGWDEITEGGLSPTAIMMWWRTWARNAVPLATAQGNEVILTPNSHYYFDYQQHANTLRDLYAFSPVPAGLDDAQKEHLLGIQANVWTEYIPSRARMQYMTFPRMPVFADVAWRGETGREWDEFYPRLLAHFPRLDRFGVNYRPLDLPGVYAVNSFVGETSVVWDYPLPAVELRYTTDGTIPDRNSQPYTGPIHIDETTEFTIRMFRPDQSAADIIRTVYRKEEYRAAVEVAEYTPGLKCVWHEGIFNRCAQIETVPIKAEYVVEAIVVPKGVGGKRGLVYTGYVEVPVDGIYTFSLTSDDGSMLYIGGEMVIDNDGPHGPITIDGQIALAKGLHPIKLYYFDMDNGGVICLRLFDAAGAEIALDISTLRH